MGLPASCHSLSPAGFPIPPFLVDLGPRRSIPLFPLRQPLAVVRFKNTPTVFSPMAASLTPSSSSADGSSFVQAQGTPRAAPFISKTDHASPGDRFAQLPNLLVAYGII